MRPTPGQTLPAGPEAHSGLRALLSTVRYEVLPLDGVVDDAAAHLPQGATVTVTASPTQGPEATLEVAEALSARGFDAVPHLSARHFSTTSAVDAVQRLGSAGVRTIFVVGGDAAAAASPGREPRHEEAAANNRSAALRDGEDLLSLLRQAAPELSIGVPGYPEGHPQIPQETLEAAFGRKLADADHVVGQLCFDPGAVCRWAEQVPAGRSGSRGPVAVYAGIPGAVSSARLLRIASRIGVGDSLRFLKSGSGIARKLAGPLRHDPTELVTGLVGANGESLLDGLHLYTFNALAQTEQWRRGLLEQLEKGDRQ